MNFFKGEITQNNGLIFKLSNSIFKIPQNFTEKLKNYVNKPITMGIRPEHILEIEKEEENSFYCDVEEAYPRK